MACKILTTLSVCIGINRGKGIKDNMIMVIYIPLYMLYIGLIMRLGHHIPDILKLINQKN